MKKETPSASESSTRMLVARVTGGMRSDAAQTGPPAWASTALTPIERRSVLLPDMLEPVTRRKVPGGPSLDVVRHPLAVRDQGVPQLLGGEPVRRAVHLGKAPLRLLEPEGGQRGERLEAAERGEPSPRLGAGIPLPFLQQEQGVEVPQEERLRGSNGDRTSGGPPRARRGDGGAPSRHEPAGPDGSEIAACPGGRDASPGPRRSAENRSSRASTRRNAP